MAALFVDADYGHVHNQGDCKTQLTFEPLVDPDCADGLASGIERRLTANGTVD